MKQNGKMVPAFKVCGGVKDRNFGERIILKEI